MYNYFGDVMKIEKIRKLNSGKYKIELEDKNKIITYDDVILKHNLLFDNNIDSDKLNELNIDTKYYDIYNKCIKYISTRLRSEKEINVYLDKFSLELEDKNKVIEDLKKIGFINDLNFTKAYISDRIYLSNDGLEKIKKNLLEHNISMDIIEEEISKIDENILKEKLSKIISKKIKNNHKDSNYVMRKKIYNDVINLGYTSQMFNECYESLEINVDSNLKKEFEKWYKKLSLKQSGEELYLKIKQKLYQKGYNLSDIDNLIQEKRDSI